MSSQNITREICTSPLVSQNFLGTGRRAAAVGPGPAEITFLLLLHQEVLFSADNLTSYWEPFCSGMLQWDQALISLGISPTGK